MLEIMPEASFIPAAADRLQHAATSPKDGRANPDEPVLAATLVQGSRGFYGNALNLKALAIAVKWRGNNRSAAPLASFSSGPGIVARSGRHRPA
ncbi:hypothetical protein ATO13_01260 [Stappia sp. 22II-S9-Z10]|nr:hypothetical protein ATO13_01260 [Stappia sp. 22II-S9-Z10]